MPPRKPLFAAALLASMAVAGCASEAIDDETSDAAAGDGARPPVEAGSAKDGGGKDATVADTGASDAPADPQDASDTADASDAIAPIDAGPDATPTIDAASDAADASDAIAPIDAGTDAHDAAPDPQDAADAHDAGPDPDAAPSDASVADAADADVPPDAGCALGTKACAQACVATTDPAYGCAGLDCTACPAAPPHGQPACALNGACGFACDLGYDPCGGGCAVAATFCAQAQPWKVTGPGITGISQPNGVIDAVTFKYELTGASVHTLQSWTYSAVAKQSGTFNFNWAYTGFHAWYMVTAKVTAYADGPGGRTYSVPNPLYQRSSGDTWNVSGTSSLTVTQGYEIGFIIEGKNFDSDTRLNGTFTVTTIP